MRVVKIAGYTIAAFLVMIVGGLLVIVWLGSTLPDKSSADRAIDLLNALPAGSNPLAVTAEDYGEDWPFTVPKGFVACAPPGSNVIFTAEGRGIYALNGRARGLMQETKNGWKEIAEIHRDNPTFFANKELVATGAKPFKVSVGPLIEKGMKLCE